jgi:VanZ family protein
MSLPENVVLSTRVISSPHVGHAFNDGRVGGLRGSRMLNQEGHFIRVTPYAEIRNGRRVRNEMPSHFELKDMKSRISNAAWITAWGLATAIVVLSVVPPVLRPETGLPHAVEHFAIYSATGLAFGVSYDRRHGLLAILLVVFAGAVEIAQLFVPGRHARVSDFTVDALATSFGVILTSLVSWVRARIGSEKFK